MCTESTGLHQLEQAILCLLPVDTVLSMQGGDRREKVARAS